MPNFIEKNTFDNSSLLCIFCAYVPTYLWIIQFVDTFLLFTIENYPSDKLSIQNESQYIAAITVIVADTIIYMYVINRKAKKLN